MATHSNILAWRIPMDRGAWRAAVHGVTKSQTRLSNRACTYVHIHRKKVSGLEHLEEVELGDERRYL